jgi:hypothetical protein
VAAFGRNQHREPVSEPACFLKKEKDMKPLTILKDEKKLDLNNSGAFCWRSYTVTEIKLQKEFQELFPLFLERGENNATNHGRWIRQLPAGTYLNFNGKHILIDGHHRRKRLCVPVSPRNPLFFTRVFFD